MLKCCFSHTRFSVVDFETVSVSVSKHVFFPSANFVVFRVFCVGFHCGLSSLACQFYFVLWFVVLLSCRFSWFLDCLSSTVGSLPHSFVVSACTAPNHRGGPLWCTRFRRVFRSRKWAREIGQKPGEDVVWQRFSQTRQDTVVGVFPMESSN